jgi:hypothetical protein
MFDNLLVRLADDGVNTEMLLSMSYLTHVYSPITRNCITLLLLMIDMLYNRYSNKAIPHLS